MNEEIPKIFKNKIDNVKSKIQNEYYYRNNNNGEDIEKNSINNIKKINRGLLLDKINYIFKRPTHVYQTDITIIDKNGESITKKIIGIKSNYLITLDGDKIFLDDIYDIK